MDHWSWSRSQSPKVLMHPKFVMFVVFKPDQVQLNTDGRILGQNLHFWRFCAHARCEYNSTCLTSPPPPLHPHAMLKTGASSFTRFLTLYWVARGVATSIVKHIYRGYYTVVRRYEFYVRVARTISHEWANENIKFISSSQRVMFFLLCGETNSTKAKCGNRDVIERYDTHKGDIRKIRHSGPGWSGVWSTSGLVPSKTLSSM